MKVGQGNPKSPFEETTARGVRSYRLDSLYLNESALRRYIRLTVGEHAGVGALLWHEMVLGLCSGLPGLLGLATRGLIYPACFSGIHIKARISRHVTLRCPRQIALAPGVILDDFVQLIATSRQPIAISLGEGTTVRSFAMINAGPPDGYVQIGGNCAIGQNVLLYGNGGLTIGDNVLIAAHSSLIASSHVFDDASVPIRDQGYTAKGITVGNDVWIGAGVRVLDGVQIGDGAIIGANAVVNRSVAPRSIMAGVPAKQIGQR